ncbi:HAD family hydrolase [Thermococcus sp.]|uniref:HAD family hydrolase n=1 Tax=Thermococcus sp. TaxID=35749 RepID=UPI0026239883|nr:HAD family hydrolase [Thermococcus sp.]
MKLVSFDVWNTLLDINGMLDAMAVELSKLMGACIIDVVEGIMLTRERIKAMRSKGTGNPERALEESQELLAELLGIEVELVKKATARAVLRVGDEIVLPGAKETLEGVKRKGLKVTVTGNVMFWPGSYTRLLLERFGLMDHIDKTFFADEVKAFKPMREMFEKPLKAFNVKPEEAIHIGDTKAEDFEGALRAGLWAVWINPEAEGVKRIHERGFEVPSVEGILEVLEEIEKN